MIEFFQMYGGGAVLFMIVCFAFSIVALKLVYELIMSIKSKTHKGFDGLHRRKHISFLLCTTIAISAQSYVLFTRHIDFFIYILADNVMLITLLALCVSVYLVLVHLAEERKGFENGEL